MILLKPARVNRSAHIQVEADLTNNNLDLLQLIQKQLGGKLVTKKNKHRNIYRLRWMNKEDIYSLLKQIHPFLILKRCNSELMLEYLKARPAHKRARLSEHDLAFPKRMIALNSKLRFRSPKFPKARGFNPKEF